MSYYRRCTDCGCYLDPGECCDCQDIEKATPDGANIRSGASESEATNNTFVTILSKN